MSRRHGPSTPELWLRDTFTSQAVARGEVMRRRRRDVERFCGLERFLDEVRQRGFQAVENGGMIVVFCNRDPIRRLR
ncbi:aspartate aminotransferase [Litorisediminicola beolgyonensis]|uniref:Aspartate aminotransferase n=1 Tax=Litorisediminicola beolgyonensis TaxID=1173614 RepID=A0ABW3ZFK1_9RHOB